MLSRWLQVTNNRMDNVNFTFAIAPTTGRLDPQYGYECPNFHIPTPRVEIKKYLKAGVTELIYQVEKLDLTREFAST